MSKAIISSESKFNKAVNALKKVLADLNAIQSILSPSLFNSNIYKQNQEIAKNALGIVSKADQGILNLKEVMLLTQSITTLSQFIIQAKIQNPLISSELITSITQTQQEAQNALLLTKQALQ